MAVPSTNYTLQVELPCGARVAVTVERKRVKNLNLRVRTTGAVALSVPERTSRARAQEFLDSRAAWIERQLEHARRDRVEASPLMPSAGRERSAIALWGERVDAARALDVTTSELQKRSADELQGLIDAHYRSEVAAVLPAVAGPLETRMGVAASRWQVRTMKTRWGSCTPATGAIRINGALAAYPPACLEAVVAHELVHLLEPSHNERFHALLDAYCPGNPEAMARLKLPPIAPGP